MLKVKNVPLLYLPVMYYPIPRDDRATGFLMPVYGNSDYRGQSVSNAFFWAIDRESGHDVRHGWMPSAGQGYGTEYRMVAGPGTDGHVRLYRFPRAGYFRSGSTWQLRHEGAGDRFAAATAKMSAKSECRLLHRRDDPAGVSAGHLQRHASDAQLRRESIRCVGTGFHQRDVPARRHVQRQHPRSHEWRAASSLMPSIADADRRAAYLFATSTDVASAVSRGGGWAAITR